jgi:CRISPR-associated protein Csb1
VFNELKNCQRVLIEADLKPIQGERFQPTGFPELGAATYTLPDGTDMLLLESAQSMANRLEAVCWDEQKKDLVELLKGMPYIKVMYEGEMLTNSILESHRLNSPYILKSTDQTFMNVLKDELKTEKDGAIDWASIAKFVFKYDPNSLIHGVFFANKEISKGRIKLTRLLSSFIEAKNIRQVESGGVKLDRVNPKANTNEGFGHVPYARTEYVADSITAYFNLDLTLLHSYHLGEVANDFLIALSLWKILHFLEFGLRLRTSCDLTCSSVRVNMPEKFIMPTTVELEAEIKSLISKIDVFIKPAITEVTFVPSANWKKISAEADNSSQILEEDEN